MCATGLLICLATLSCKEAAQGEVSPPAEEEVRSRLRLDATIELLLTRNDVGGGAGDTVYRLLLCRESSPSCEILSMVDTNDKAAPELIPHDKGAVLLVNQGDSLAQFRNFGRHVEGLRTGLLLLRYR
jgi:hypothetical protein